MKKNFETELEGILKASEPTEAEREAIEQRFLTSLAWRPIPKADFVRTLLSPMLAATEADVERCELSEDGRYVLIHRQDGHADAIDVQGLNLIGTAVAVMSVF